MRITDDEADGWHPEGPTCRQCDQPRLWRMADRQNSPDAVDEVMEVYCERCDKIEELTR